MPISAYRRFRTPLIVAAVCTALSVGWVRSLTEAPAVADAVHNLNMGVNLAHYGTISGHGEAPVEPTMYREPLPAFAIALSVRLVDAGLGRAEPAEYRSGPRIRYLKYQNVVWAAAMTAATYGLLLLLTGSAAAAVTGAVLVNVKVPGIYTPNIDTLLTEPVAQAFLAVCAFLLVLWSRTGRHRLLFLAGLSFGLLALTKASFLYVFIVFVALLPFVPALSVAPPDFRTRQALRQAATQMAVISAGFFLVVLPWMGRNYAHFGTFSLSERSGVILMQRAMNNGLTADEYLGAFYVYAPNDPLQAILGRMAGYTSADAQRGGRLQRLTHGRNTDFWEDDLAAEQDGRPDDAICLYRQARAWRVKLTREYEDAGLDRPFSRADDELRRRAVGMIVADPLAHLSFTVLALWRGAFFAFPVLLVALLYARRRGRTDIVLAALPAFGMVMLYALATPFEARMGMTVKPLAVALGFVLVLAAWRRFAPSARAVQRAA